MQEIEKAGLSDLLERLPECAYQAGFSPVGDLWRYSFFGQANVGRFQASAVRRSPREAFLSVRAGLFQQIREWHARRFANAGLSLEQTFFSDALPKVLLIEDDQDLALAMHTAFDQNGWRTDIAVEHQDLHRKIAETDASYIILDWNLNDSVTADRVFEKAIRLIDAFSDLRTKFSQLRPRIVTCSALDGAKIRVPDTGWRYFEYADHWQKPVPFTEVVARAKRLMLSK